MHTLCSRALPIMLHFSHACVPACLMLPQCITPLLCSFAAHFWRLHCTGSVSDGACRKIVGFEGFLCLSLLLVLLRVLLLVVAILTVCALCAVQRGYGWNLLLFAVVCVLCMQVCVHVYTHSDLRVCRTKTKQDLKQLIATVDQVICLILSGVQDHKIQTDSWQRPRSLRLLGWVNAALRKLPGQLEGPVGSVV